ncbi:phage repressor protein [Salmonella enterica subsp. enterica]|uniref:Helix-turn-helix domain-containing protein n=1 Tax=Salmonella enterica TaxID=28901 RepID=A0A754B2K0_SALER|nr:S24 family peptidase [Salmonella enterica]EAA3939216.1 phage repressor protein [Salmonella enterica subsp. enterica serovar Bareilly]ECU9163660.1 phage repressor protein [Salmonella enterica subsp. enterica serovar Newport str. CFSAN000599]EDU1196992.1 helix-turn-helix domain-containing protein [Salmonella enterica subsp. enterica serovar Heidelberg str. CFSAN000576]HAF8580750.1 helix-turn-helix domain-containing protein [Salmonella enterica]
MGFTTEKLIANINLLMSQKGITNVTELAKQIRIPQPTMHRLLSGDVKEPKYALLKQIADFFKLSVQELVETDLLRTAGSQSVEPTKVGTLRFTEVPVVGGAQLGNGGHWTNLQYPVGYGDGYISWPTRDPDAYALRCTGDSMKPRIKDGEYVVIEPNHQFLPGDEVLVVTKDERAMVKTFLYERDGEVMVMSINEEHLPIRFSLSEIESIHYVAGIAKPSLRIDY